MPSHIKAGVISEAEWASQHGFRRRTGGYYREVCQQLGLVALTHGRMELTPDGVKFVNMKAADQFSQIERRIVKIPIIALVLSSLRSDGIDRSEITAIVQAHTDLSRSTADRRASTVLSYLRWLGRINGGYYYRHGKLYRSR